MVDTCGLSYIWLNQNVNCKRNIFLNTVAVNFQNQFRQQWKSDIEESSKCLNYKMLKTEHCLEKYLVTAYKPVLTLELQTIIYRLKPLAGLELKELNVNVPNVT